MKVIGINGSPRKKWNTATLLAKALEGAASKGAETETIHLYDLDFKGCISCFACKTKGGKSYGRCAVKDDLATVLEKVQEVDAMVLGSPIYFGTVTGEMRSFMERLLFPYLAYTNPPSSLFQRKINTGFIYTMNAPEERIGQYGSQHIGLNEMILKMVFGSSESLMSYETYQFDDYSKVVSDFFDVEQRTKRRKEVFPADCAKAFEFGAKLASAPA
jgi:multimeric flavodoxin WrbA